MHVYDFATVPSVRSNHLLVSCYQGVPKPHILQLPADHNIVLQVKVCMDLQ